MRCTIEHDCSISGHEKSLRATQLEQKRALLKTRVRNVKPSWSTYPGACKSQSVCKPDRLTLASLNGLDGTCTATEPRNHASEGAADVLQPAPFAQTLFNCRMQTRGEEETGLRAIQSTRAHAHVHGPPATLLKAKLSTFIYLFSQPHWLMAQPCCCPGPVRVFHMCSALLAKSRHCLTAVRPSRRYIVCDISIDHRFTA